ncbi:MAG: IS701 family transposase [Chloroflexi bacterium]|uniref:IS701 family transposase n=1 Tax=Candidatus Chlorohelix allophototropha TaxID=3003348 RepID=A0A8T7M688_9CHLR|nr:IS701 family transposase [Chloroflexota bacterium]WJW69542.1 IS701 family transposase [Chloroflexota bacterium L227-S17]
MERYSPSQSILVVEDSDEDYEAILWAFKKLAAPQTVRRCEDGDEALDYLHRRGKYSEEVDPSLILLDLNLPGTDGREVLQQIKQDPKLRMLPVVVLTSSSNPQDIDRCYIEGANSYLHKPVNLEGFVKSLKVVLDYWFGAMERVFEGYKNYRVEQQPVFTDPMLIELHSRISKYFLRSETRAQVLAYIKALLSDAKRKNCWQLAAQAGDSNPAKMQRLLSHAQWDADLVRNQLREYMVERLGHPNSVLVIDEVSFPKKGSKSAGVARQISYQTGTIENCQKGIFLTYNSPLGNVILDRELYLPQEWINDTQNRSFAMIPENMKHRSRPEFARHMLESTVAAGVPFRWVAGNIIYGNDRTLRQWLEEKSIPFLFEINPEMIEWQGILSKIAAKDIDNYLSALDSSTWTQVNSKQKLFGYDYYDWNLIRVDGLQKTNGWCTWLLIRRKAGTQNEYRYYLVFGPSSTSLPDMVQVEGQYRLNEKIWKMAKNEVGLDQYEVRYWHGWYRHITLAMAAYVYHISANS